MLIVCVLASNATKTKFIVQPYLRPSDSANLIDSNLVKVRKFFANEVFKSDMYALITTNEQAHFKRCFVVSIKDYLQNQISLRQNESENLSEEHDVYICESMYSTCYRYFRKLTYKKWQPLKFIGSNSSSEDGPEIPTDDLLEFTKRAESLDARLE